MKLFEKFMAEHVGQFDGKYITASWTYQSETSDWLLSLFNGEYAMRRVTLASAEACYEYALHTEAAMYRAFNDLPADTPVDVENGDSYAVAPDTTFCVDVPAETVEEDVQAIIAGFPAPFMWNGRYITCNIYEDDSYKANGPKTGAFTGVIQLYDSSKIICGHSGKELRDFAFWLDRCIERFLHDGVIIICDDGTPAARAVTGSASGAKLTITYTNVGF